MADYVVIYIYFSAVPHPRWFYVYRIPFILFSFFVCNCIISQIQAEYNNKAVTIRLQGGYSFGLSGYNLLQKMPLSRERGINNIFSLKRHTTFRICKAARYPRGQSVCYILLFIVSASQARYPRSQSVCYILLLKVSASQARYPRGQSVCYILLFIVSASQLSVKVHYLPNLQGEAIEKFLPSFFQKAGRRRQLVLVLERKRPLVPVLERKRQLNPPDL